MQKSVLIAGLGSTLLGLGMLSLSGCGGGSLGDQLGLGLNSIGHTPAAPVTPVPFVPLTQYVGTWTGTWQDPFPTNVIGPSGQPLGQVGTLSLTVGADGHMSGQVVDTTTGQSGTITEDIVTANGKTQGYVKNVSCTLGGTPLTGGSANPIDAQGHWFIAFLIPPLPSETIGTSTNGKPLTQIEAISRDLARQ